MPNPSRENFGPPEGFDRFREEYDIRPEFRAKFLAIPTGINPVLLLVVSPKSKHLVSLLFVVFMGFCVALALFFTWFSLACMGWSMHRGSQ